MAKNDNKGKYKDLGDLSEKHLNLGLWFLENKKKFKQLIIIFLIVFTASTLSYSAYHLLSYWLGGQAEHQAMLVDMTNVKIGSEELREILAPDNLLFSFVKVFYVDAKLDYMAKISNPNTRHRADFYYCFQDGELELACDNAFILPSEDKYLMQLAQGITSSLGNVQLVIKDISWQRISAHKINDWSQFKNERINLELENTSLKTEGSNYNLSFSIANRSSYGYYQLPLQIILFNSAGETGANRYLLSNFRSGEKINLSISWPAGSERATKAIIVPDLDILNDDIYLPYRGENR